MYVCLCNSLTCRDVRTARDLGARTPAQVFKTYGTRPECGRCLPCMREILAEAPATEEAEDALVAVAAAS